MQTYQRMKWAYDLRSGLYSQITGRLRGDGGERCCLGVYGDVICAPWLRRYDDDDHVWSTGNMSGTLPEEYLDPDVQDCFTHLNDSVKLTFSQIADFVEYGAVPKPPNAFAAGDPSERENTITWVSI